MGFLKRLFGGGQPKNNIPEQNMPYQNIPGYNELESNRLKELSKTGITESICPYCGIPLEKFQEIETKCKACGNFIYVRTRPTDNKKVLIKEDEIEIYEEIKAIEYGEYDKYIEMRNFKNKIENDKGRKVSKEELEIYTKEKVINKNISEKKWDILSGDFIELGILYNSIRKVKKSINMFLLSFYCSVNCESADYEKNEFFHINKNINFKNSIMLNKLIKDNNINYEDTVKYVNHFTKKLHEKYGFPLPPEEFSPLVRERFFNGSDH
jgi:uncharacterized Zn finger protein (UPF0148 family)